MSRELSVVGLTVGGARVDVEVIPWVTCPPQALVNPSKRHRRRIRSRSAVNILERRGRARYEACCHVAAKKPRRIHVQRSRTYHPKRVRYCSIPSRSYKGAHPTGPIGTHCSWPNRRPTRCPGVVHVVSHHQTPICGTFVEVIVVVVADVVPSGPPGFPWQPSSKRHPRQKWLRVNIRIHRQNSFDHRTQFCDGAVIVLFGVGLEFINPLIGPRRGKFVR